MRKGILRRLAALALLAATLCTGATALARDEMKNTDADRYRLYLNMRDQVLTAYEKDDDGAYTRIVRRMLCSTGADLTPTPTGTYKIGGKERFGKFAHFNGEYARYWTQVVRGIYIHSIGFSGRDVQKLLRTPFSNMGKRASHGCIRLYVEYAKWVYYNICPGSSITIGNDEPPLSKAEKKSLKSPLDYEAYKAYQAAIADDAPELADRHAWVTFDNAQLRTGNGSNDEFIRRLKAGTEVRVLQEGDPWVKVAVDDREGYVKRIYVTYQKDAVETYENGRATKTTTDVFAEPDVKAEKLCRMPRDTSLNILETDPEKGWYKIRYWDIEGYIQIRKTRPDISMFPYDEAAQLAAYAARMGLPTPEPTADITPSPVAETTPKPPKTPRPETSLAPERTPASEESATPADSSGALTTEEVEQDDLLDAGFAG
ncbi:MAG: SH3 domain-containing protein [Eubacteriales bacterium]|nr:SH3 domain-containing protein [Eubacteriales bacterium]